LANSATSTARSLVPWNAGSEYLDPQSAADRQDLADFTGRADRRQTVASRRFDDGFESVQEAEVPAVVVAACQGIWLSDAWSERQIDFRGKRNQASQAGAENGHCR